MRHFTTSLGLAALLGSLALAPSLRAQETGLAPGEPAAQVASPDTEEATRLLYLANGGVLRVRSRHSDEGWEIQQGREDWNSLPDSAVLRSVLERDALANAKRLEAQVGRGPRAEQNTRRAALADWMLRTGLTNEGMGQLDRVLSSDPDQAQALAALARLAPTLGVGAIDKAMGEPDSTLAVLRAAANATPSVREIAIQRLASGGASDELRVELHAQLVSHSPRLRALAALALRRIYPGKNLRIDDVKELIKRSVLDGSDDVRAEASRALRDVQDPTVAVAAMRALSSANPRLRENSIEALGMMGYPGSVEPLVNYLGRVNAAVQGGGGSGVASSGSIFIGTQTAYIQDFDVEVANASSIADPQVNVLIEGSVLDARVIGSYTVSFAGEARLVRDALGNLTGQDLGSSNRAWLAWWDENKSTWNQPTPPAPGTTTAALPARQ